MASSLLSKVKTEIKHPQGKYRLPLPSQQMDSWSLPSQLKEKVTLLCSTLSEMESSQESVIKEDGGAANLTDSGLTLFWERDDYAPIVYSEGLEWPSFVRHERMELAQNRTPLVPGVSHPKNPFNVTGDQVPAQQQATA